MLRSLFAASSLLAAFTSAITPVTIKGNGFFTGNDRLYIVGIDYQPGGPVDLDQGIDPFSDLSQCQRDVYLLQQLGANAIRTYAVNTTLNHDPCLSLFNAAGIYVILDVNAPGWQYSVHREEPWTSYSSLYLSNVFSVIDQFSGYPNVLGFFSGNELANDPKSANVTAPYMRAIQRDMRQYIKAQNLRNIPIGYSTADVVEFREELGEYLSCMGDDGGHSDFYGINSYEVCKPKEKFEESGYKQLTENMGDVHLPIFFSEYGCNINLPRAFGDAELIYSEDMNHVFSGGMVYEFNQEKNNYGLVDVDFKTGNAKILPDYETLREVYNNIKYPTGVSINSQSAPKCSDILSKIKSFTATAPIPKQPPGVADLIKNGVKVERGKIIDVDLDLAGRKWEITDVNGAVIQNPKIAAVSGYNTIGSAGSATSSGDGSSKSSENAAPSYYKGGNELAVVAVVGMTSLFVMAGGFLL